MLLLYAGAALAVVGAIGYGAWKIHHTGYEKGKAEVQLEWDTAKAEQRAKEAKQIDTATTKREAQREKIRTVYKTITKNVDRYIDRPIYAAACIDDSGLRDINAALRGPDAPAGKPGSRLPGPDAARGSDGSKPAP